MGVEGHHGNRLALCVTGRDDLGHPSRQRAHARPETAVLILDLDQHRRPARDHVEDGLQRGDRFIRAEQPGCARFGRRQGRDHAVPPRKPPKAIVVEY